ncbi:hypothetical protein T8J41_19700 (plasmid) [Nitratireductor rhodophyticola]|jgi:hypothetical protein|uniref:hypothetical protein n=1 Tax=Nitratireductor TaxID=245876 RepID=UPI000C8EE5AD|nr:hypothetical protein [Nitratireductor rhodophyticola]MAS15434.1 hypothetical protein [Nitratireductor sp.]MBY8922966.1 hypothetical protein [Nitratireductor rhodophyticola]WPZ16415.1 hypothetical protein T8J41_19700 [Nitratireductor rhodophyticola]
MISRGGAAQDFIAGDEARRAVDPPRLGELEIALDLGVDRGILRVGLELFDIMDRHFGAGHEPSLVDRSRDLHQRLAERRIVTAASCPP